MNFKGFFTDGGDAHEQITRTTIGSWTEGEEAIEVSEAMPWHQGELNPEQPGTMGSRQLEENHSFGSWELHE